MTRLRALWLLLFVALNFLLYLAHIQLFQSAWPYSAWVSMGAHVIGLLFFPYAHFFNFSPKQPK
jgi:hypothetical protein